MNAETFEAIRRAIGLVSDGEAKKIEGEGWKVYFIPGGVVAAKVYFIPGGDYGTVRVDIDRGTL